MTHELLGQLGARKETFTQNPVSIEQMGELIDMVQDGSITGEHILHKLVFSALTSTQGTSGKTLLHHMITHRSREMPSKLAADLSLAALSENSSSDSLKRLCEEAIAALPEEAGVVRKGNERVIMKLVGKVMRDSRGRADAKAATDLLKELLLPKQ
jgi:aspartyl-tRNA(Asn)/glutamyl-tRNA(Gln) amidotransferase subunit B